MEKIALLLFVPGGTGWNYNSVRLQRQGRNAGGGAGELAEEGNKNAFVCLRVEIRQNAERAAFAQHAQRLARCALLINRVVAKPGSNPFHHFFDALIVERPHQKTKRILECGPTETM